MRPAGLGRRLLSLVYEFFLLAGVWLSLVLFPQTIAATALSTAAPGWLVWVHSFIVLAAMYCWLWSSGRQTLAMKTWRLKLLTDEGENLQVAHAAMRYFWAWPSYGLLGIGVLWAIFDADGKLLHDRLARTQLVSETPPA